MGRSPQINGALHREPEQGPISAELFVGSAWDLWVAVVSPQVNIALRATRVLPRDMDIYLCSK